MFCTNCGNKLGDTHAFCSQCGEPTTRTTTPVKNEMQQPALSQEASVGTQAKKLKCPKCASDELTSGKKGFSGSQAVGGAILTGGIGILAGTIGSNKIKITCLACGFQFKPGEDLESQKLRLEKDVKSMENPAGCIILIIVIIFIIWLMTR